MALVFMAVKVYLDFRFYSSSSSLPKEPKTRSGVVVSFFPEAVLER